MDSSNNQPQEQNPNLNKLEEDLQNLTKEASEQSGNTQTPTVASSLEVPENTVTKGTSAEPAQSLPVEVDVNNSTTPVPDAEKKSSPVLAVALVLMIIAVIVAIAYVIGTKYFGTRPEDIKIPISTVTPMPKYTELPFPTATSSASPVATNSAVPILSSTSAPSAIPQQIEF